MFLTGTLFIKSLLIQLRINTLYNIPIHAWRLFSLTNVFITPGQLNGDRLCITGGDADHLTRVLRLGLADGFTALANSPEI